MSVYTVKSQKKEWLYPLSYCQTIKALTHNIPTFPSIYCIISLSCSLSYQRVFITLSLKKNLNGNFN